MSLTQWLTRSSPTVSWMPAIWATLSLVPTPSAEATSTWPCGLSGSRENRPPNDPISDRTPVVKVDLANRFTPASAWSWASMSTPDAA